MPAYRYQSLTARGEARNGVLTAGGRVAAIRQLEGRGETPTAIHLADENDAAAVPAPTAALVAQTDGAATILQALPQALRRGRARPRASRAELANLVRELATALEAGLPLMQALRTVRRQASSRAMEVILDHLLERVESGAPLHQAAQEYGPPFDDLTVGMLRAADASGRMSEVLHQLADLMDRSIELRGEVLGATLYPAIVFCLVVISAVILVTLIVPQLIAPLIGQFADLPMATRIVLGLAEFISAWWFVCLGLALAAWLGWRAWVAHPANRLRVDRMKLQLPVAGRLLRDVAVARFTRTLGTLSAAGIPILDALRITRGTLGNSAMMAAIDEVSERVTSGAALADPLEKSGLFPPLLVQVVNLGERSGRLESMLLHAAGAFDRQVNQSLKLFTRALPPVLIMIMAALGAFVLAAILLPLLQLQTLVQ